MEKISAKLSFGKIAYSGTRKINEVILTLNLRPKFNVVDFEKNILIPEAYELAICGEIWDGKKYDIECGGQCLNEISKHIKTPEFKRIRQIWEQYHLNDMKAGTKLQCQAIELWERRGNKYDYTAACEHLKVIGLYEDEGYKYGHQWLFEPIPAEIITEIKKLFKVTD